MKNKTILLGIITVALLMSVGTVIAAPYNSLAHRQDGVSADGTTHVLANWLPNPLGNALEIKNQDGQKFVQWWEGVHCVCQCTDGMNPDALQSKLNDGWVQWTAGSGDPRYDWCPYSHTFVCLPYDLSFFQ